jgi:hypothetical protein
LEIEPLTPATELMLRNRRSVWHFLTTCCYTLDEADRWNPIKKFPDDKEYLKPLVEMVERDPLTAIVKHRRMIVSWAIAGGLGLWDAMFHEGRHIAVVSSKEEKSAELVNRARFMYDNIPKGALPIKPRMEAKYGELRFPEINSMIKGYAQGPDQLRQYTCSRVICDEIAFWMQARATFTSLKPTIEGGGKICLISTRYPGFFQEVVEDRLNAA